MTDLAVENLEPGQVAEGPQLSLEGLLGVRNTALYIDLRVTGPVSVPWY